MTTTAATTPASETQLLPRTHGDFSTVQYWDQFFETRDGDEFEWYGTFSVKVEIGRSA